MSNEIAGAVWSPVSNYRDHGSYPWGTVSGIDLAADWIWGSSLLPGSGYGEYQIFRIQVGEKMVVICHIPPGNPSNHQTITVGAAAVQAHLDHGDTLGACQGESNQGGRQQRR